MTIASTKAELSVTEGRKKIGKSFFESVGCFVENDGASLVYKACQHFFLFAVLGQKAFEDKPSAVKSRSAKSAYGGAGTRNGNDLYAALPRAFAKLGAGI